MKIRFNVGSGAILLIFMLTCLAPSVEGNGAGTTKKNASVKDGKGSGGYNKSGGKVDSKSRTRWGNPIQQRKLPNNRGAVIFSFTTSGPDFHANPILTYQHISQDITGQVAFSGIYNERMMSEFSHAYGSVKMLILKPGLYEFNQWQTSFPGQQFNFFNEHPFHILFRVVPGKIAYIGNINLALNFDTENHPLFAVTIYDFANRDIRVFKQQTQSYRSVPIHKRLAKNQNNLNISKYANRWMSFRDYYE